jgi:hypothetical protein
VQKQGADDSISGATVSPPTILAPIQPLIKASHTMMQIWVDADACPVVIKEILYRVAERLQLNVTLVANQLMRVPG